MLAVTLLQAASLTVGASATPNDAWSALAKADVAAVCDAVRGIHPAMRDPATPNFAANVDEACARAATEAADVVDFPSWRLALTSLTTSFRDGHFSLRTMVEPARVRWPGFLVNGQGASYVVRYPEGHAADPETPPEGSRLVSCDGVAAEALMQQHLDGRWADRSKAPERLRQAYRLLIDDRLAGAVPVTACRVELDGTQRDYLLEWREIAWSAISTKLAPFTRRATRPVGIEWLPDGGVWISLGNVSQEGRLRELQQTMRQGQDRLRAAPFVVFDLRGGAGGNSMWGGTLAGILWGEQAVEARRSASRSSDPSATGKYWRASTESARAIRAVGDEFAARGTDMAEVAEFWHALALEIEQKVDGDQSLLQDECCRPSEAAPPELAPAAYAGKTFVVTDAGTFSSSVVVMNTLKRMGAVQVGEPSGQNEVYGESIGPILLPSGLGSVRVPVSLIRQPRDQLGGLPPDIAFDGPMDNDLAVRNWVIGLAKRP